MILECFLTIEANNFYENVVVRIRLGCFVRYFRLHNPLLGFKIYILWFWNDILGFWNDILGLFSPFLGFDNPKIAVRNPVFKVSNLKLPF